MSSSINYRGRFAPSPTGPLHFGSLVAAVGSYLDAKHHRGIWLVRMEDLDTPRCVPGAADDILRTLEAFGLYWDEGQALPAVEKAMSSRFVRLKTGSARPTVLHQSQRTAAYEAALQKLQAIGAAYPCSCTRKEIADSALHGIEGHVYPGTCRNGIPSGRKASAWRILTNIPIPVRPAPVEGQVGRFNRPKTGFDKLSPNGLVEFNDALQGRITQHLESEVGDFVVKRADGLFAYQLAVVVDDAYQGITHVVRGADLLASTPRQIHLQQLLGLPVPAYMHLPVTVNAQGEKLSKQTLAPAITRDDAIATMIKVLEFLQQRPPADLQQNNIGEILNWAVTNWQPDKLAGCRQRSTG